MTELEQYNAQTISDIDDEDFFLIYYFPKLPYTSNNRYSEISTYTSSKYANGMEWSRCVEFEILARDKTNVYAIEHTIEFYSQNISIFQNCDRTLPNHSDVYNQLKERLQGLRLIPYKYYQEEEKLQHWAVNPLIYEIMNYLNIKDAPQKYQSVDVIPSEKITSYFTKQANEDYKYNEIKYLNDFTILHQMSTLKSSYIDSDKLLEIQKKYANAKTEEEKIEMENTSLLSEYYHVMDSAKKEFLATKNNKNIVYNKITYKHHYPRLRPVSKLNIEIDLTSNAKSIKDFLNDVVKSIDAGADKNDYNFFNISTEERKRNKYESYFFTYDYFTYRKEQIEHRLRYLDMGSLYDDVEIEEDMVSDANDAKIYRELQQLIGHTIKHDTSKQVSTQKITDDISFITKLIEKSKTSVTFLIQ